MLDRMLDDYIFYLYVLKILYPVTLKWPLIPPQKSYGCPKIFIYLYGGKS